MIVCTAWIPFAPLAGIKKTYIFMASCPVHNLDVSAHASTDSHILDGLLLNKKCPSSLLYVSHCLIIRPQGSYLYLCILYTIHTIYTVYMKIKWFIIIIIIIIFTVYLFCTKVQLLLFAWWGTFCRSQGCGFACSPLLNTTWRDLLCKLNSAATSNVSNLMLCIWSMIALCGQLRVYNKP